MYIKSVIVDGFKSYAHRTEVAGFDPQFNAITGLNGSGKSNILDSICFLLGITNLSAVRAGNLQDLVYKNGQAGVTKATVSIIFDNRDKKQSPFGYEQFDELTITRQIVLGGKNKYLINGTNSTNSRVQDLFCSVNLNVNNPHFLIMQGRITKVLNMKPPEILSLLEEAASTRLYESKKENVLKIFEKKDFKLKEIAKILKDDINPTLAKLRKERSSYLEYQKILRDIEHRTKFCLAYQYKSYEEIKEKTKEDLDEMRSNQAEKKQRFLEIGEEKDALELNINELCRERDLHQGGALEELESKHSECQKEEAVIQGALQRATDAVKDATQRRREVQAQLKESTVLSEGKTKELESMRVEFDSWQNAADTAERDCDAAHKHLQAVLSGLVTNEDGADATLEEQLRTAQQDSVAADTDKRRAEMRVVTLTGEVKDKEADLKKTNQNFAREDSAKGDLTSRLKELDGELAKLGYTEGGEERIAEEQLAVSREVRELRDRVNDISSRHPNMVFEYADPQPRFDRRRVKGIVAKLFSLKDPNFATAVEVCAGGKLYNVIVDTEQTGKMLLDNGRLRRRVTMLPLNKMRGNVVPDRVLQRAQELVGRDKVWTALSLVEYPEELRPAMEYVLGGALVCTDLDTAKQVAFHPEVERRTVTLEGDVFDPQGTLSGGSRSQAASLLLSLGDMRDSEELLHSTEQRLAELNTSLHAVRSKAERWGDLRQRADEARHELDLLTQRLKQTDFHRISDDIAAAKEEIVELKNTIKEAGERLVKANKKASNVQERISNSKAFREREIKEAEAGVAESKRRMEESAALLSSRRTKFDSLGMEIEELSKEIANIKVQVEESETGLLTAAEELETKKEAAGVCKKTVQAAKEELVAHRDMIKKQNREINEKQTLVGRLAKERADAELKVDELERKIQLQIKESKDAGTKLETLMELHPWIVEERRHFGQPGTAYDFAEHDPREAKKRIEKLTERRDKLSQTVNMRAMNQLGTAEDQCAELQRREQIVKDDKAKIQDIIDEMDKKKKDAVAKAHEKVNKDFNSIFSTLLPGTKAQLVPPEGQTIFDGLQFRVAFGDVWKESLSELSGGQRSLVALSLILSLLLFNPAPLYILDEVDAALDLSHTQNIGQLIKNHFKHSQFVVVSLKDGMFNNANVLFKTKFVDGVSTVSRQIQRPLATKNTNKTDKQRR